MCYDSMELQSAEEKRSTGYCYSDISSAKPNIQTHLVNQLQSFESNSEIYSLSSTGMEIIGFPPKNLQQQQQSSHDTNSGLWKGFFTKSGGGPSSSSSKAAIMSDFYQHDQFNKPDFTYGDQTLSWHDQNRVLVDDSSLRCVFPCEGNERPSQGLSLSLSSTHPSTLGLQSFELRQEGTHGHDQLRFVSSSSRSSDGLYGNSMMQDGFLGKASILQHQGHFMIKNSKYLGPAQQLLNEFCDLGTKQTDHPIKIKPHKTTQLWQDENAMSSSSKKHSLYTLELLELQKRKTKLLSMLEEVDRRYRGYCDQMKAVVLSFEEAAGNGAATVYSALASKAMSRHFRCLRDGIVDQIKATKKAMGEKDTVAPGTSRGETPRLRALDQALRQQRAFQQMGMMESHPWRPQRGLPDRSVSVLRAWLFEHFLHPYPTDVDKHILARQTGLSRSQVSNWFINARVRLWKPMVEEMYLEETKEQDKSASSDEIAALGDDNGRPNQSSQARHDDKKPTPAQLVRIDSECLSSIINNPEKNDTPKYHNLHHHHHHQHTNSFGAVELDFASYARQHFGGGGNGSGTGDVSLTLGLQQHGGSGVSLAFSPPSHNSLLYPRDHIEDCQTVHQYSLLDGEGQNLPYRNLMGAQLLHDLA
ncbi:homeobox protein BEL1 homolog [Cornus florida]|uniref:homeobox protein BEL1 homolog n=1 Tax=Cornus florida TaxID=4283 RepID=UPI00289FBCF0|nr:homeobox protein BEL1 homolog [Cornus florida]XP_059661831.1 homeobox protein BEL1 homolog [Cornus florida]